MYQNLFYTRYRKWGKLLLNLSENKWFTANYQKDLAEMVQAKGAPLTNFLVTLMPLLEQYADQQ
jgi:hypothetical protein